MRNFVYKRGCADGKFAFIMGEGCFRPSIPGQMLANSKSESISCHDNEAKKWVQQVVALEKKVDAIDAEKRRMQDEIAAFKLDINQFMAELGASDLKLEKLQMENAELVATLIQ